LLSIYSRRQKGKASKVIVWLIKNALITFAVAINYTLKGEAFFYKNNALTESLSARMLRPYP